MKWVKRYEELRRDLNMMEAITKLVEEVKAESPTPVVEQQELLPEEKEVINEWRRARLSVRKGNFDSAEHRIEQAKKIIGDANEYYTDKTNIPELL